MFIFVPGKSLSRLSCSNIKKKKSKHTVYVSVPYITKLEPNNKFFYRVILKLRRNYHLALSLNPGLLKMSKCTEIEQLSFIDERIHGLNLPLARNRKKKSF